MATDLYKELGVSKGASADEIKKVYKKLASQLHPDKNPGDQKIEARFKAVKSRVFTSLLFFIVYWSARDPEKRQYLLEGVSVGLLSVAAFAVGETFFGVKAPGERIEGLFDAQGLPPAISPFVDRSPTPVFADGRQVGKATSHGWSPILKQAIALAYVPARYERTGTRLQVEWSVEGRRGRVAASVVELPFLDLDRKRS